MFFAYGWPRALAAFEGPGQEDVVYLHLDTDYCLIVSTGSVQIWTGGQHRIRLGHLAREETTLKNEGPNKCAYWCSSRRLLAVLTYNNVLLIYGLHVSKDSALQTPGSGAGGHGPLDLKRQNFYMQYKIVVETTSNCTDLLGDSRGILIALSDGSFTLWSWHGKFRGQHNPFAVHTEAQSRPQGISRMLSISSRWAGYGGGPGTGGSSSAASLSPATVAAIHGRSSSPLAQRNSIGSQGSGGLSRSLSGGQQHEDAHPACIESMDYSSSMRMLAVVFTDGRCAMVRTGEGGLAPLEHLEFSHLLCSVGSGATVARIGSAAQMVAVGLTSGDIALYRLWGPATPGGSKPPDPLRVMSLADWGHGPESTGSVADLQWSPDSRALAVGWRRSGLGLWSPSGCRLMCSLRQSPTSRMQAFSSQTPRGSPTSQTHATPFNSHKTHAQAALPLENGLAAIAWSPHGYHLLMAEAGSAGQVLEVALARSLAGSHRVLQTSGPPPDGRFPQEVYLLQAADRLLMITEASASAAQRDMAGSTSFAQLNGPPEPSNAATSDLTVHHLRVPQQYISANYPIAHAAMSPDGVDIAVAGSKGLALYSRRSLKWRLFGDVSQERAFSVRMLLWLPRIVVACVERQALTAQEAKPGAIAELLLFPRYHLDMGSLLARHSLSQVPRAMDAVGNFLVIASGSLEIVVMRVDVIGSMAPNGNPSAKLSAVRELSIMSMGAPIQEIALVEPSVGPPVEDGPESSGKAGPEPRHCVLLRSGGAMSVLDLAQGSEASLADDVECFWLSGPAPWTKASMQKVASLQNAAKLDKLGRSPSTDGVLSSGGSTVRGPHHPSANGTVSSSLAPLARSNSNTSSASSTAAVPRAPDVGGWLAGAARPTGHPPPISASAYAAARLDAVANPPPPSNFQEARQSPTPRDQPLSTPRYSNSHSELARRGSQHSHRSSFDAAGGSSNFRWRRSEASGSEPGADEPSEAPAIPSGEVEIPWWTYGARGMQLWFPSSLNQPLSPHARDANARASIDPELEFDREVYPVGISLADVAIIGVTQRLTRSPLGGKASEGLTLAQRHATAPHFPRSLEWLLFTALELEVDAPQRKGTAPARQTSRIGQQEMPKPRKAGPLLLAVTELIRQFPQYREVVVSVARKTDASMWPALFAAAGDPGELLKGLSQQGALQSAACSLLIVDRLQGPDIAQSLALQLLQDSLAAEQYELAAELLRFLIPPQEASALMASADLATPRQRLSIRTQPPPSANPQAAQQPGWFAMLFGAPGSKPSVPSPAPPKDQKDAGGESLLARLSGSPRSPVSQQTPGLQAWHLLGAHAWQLLSAGRLKSLAHLARPLPLAGASLPALLASTKGAVSSLSHPGHKLAQASQSTPGPEQPPSALHLASAISIAAAELSVQTDREAAADAELLLAAVQSADAPEWTLALALLLDDQRAISGVRPALGQQWTDLEAIISAEKQYHKLQVAGSWCLWRGAGAYALYKMWLMPQYSKAGHRVQSVPA
ncbi:hypothetical protein WJX74_010194 [Apatococcus lobatus]|uniref:RIC1 C-terminal alpha solenoid region domain-containing protein n=1 Tax=Apatococcus lobatus TaxID=904363 RepID=A0AAW1RC53_9CHLO